MAASLFLHALIATFLFFGLPRPDQQPDQQEPPVNVAIVPPPDQPKPKPAPKPTEPEKKAEKPPEQKPPPEPPKPKPPEDQVLKRVFEYGKKDSGPAKSLDGESAQPNTPQQAKEEPAKPPVVPTPAPPQSPQPASPQPQAQPSKPQETPDAVPPDAKSAQSEQEQATQDNDKQQPDKQEEQSQLADRQAADTPKPLTAETGNKPAPPAAVTKAKPRRARKMTFKPATSFSAKVGNPGKSKPTNSDAVGSPIYAGLPGVRKLYSQGATGDPFATSSMENVPRGERVATLCGNVLSRELQRADYSVKWVPTIQQDKGNILNAQLTAFSTRKAWYDLNFRCEVDSDATRVLSFSFRVGALIPPGEWAARGFGKYPLD